MEEAGPCIGRAEKNQAQTAQTDDRALVIHESIYTYE